jgi:hypothetical protein
MMTLNNGDDVLDADNFEDSRVELRNTGHNLVRRLHLLSHVVCVLHYSLSIIDMHYAIKSTTRLRFMA